MSSLLTNNTLVVEETITTSSTTTIHHHHHHQVEPVINHELTHRSNSMRSRARTRSLLAASANTPSSKSSPSLTDNRNSASGVSRHVISSLARTQELNLNMDLSELSMMEPNNIKRAVNLFKIEGLRAKVKCVSKGEKNIKERVCRLDMDESYFEIWNKKQKKRKISIFLKDVFEIVSKVAVVARESKFKRMFNTFSKIGGKKASTTTTVTTTTEVNNISFTIRYGSQKREELQIVCATREDYDTWMIALNYLVREAHLVYDSNPTKVLILKQWMLADKNGDGKLSRKEISNLLHSLNIDTNRSLLNNQFNQADVDNSGYLDYGEFIEFYKTLMKRREVDAIFDKYNTKFGQVVFAEEFLRFLHEEQGETEITMEEAVELMQINGAILTEMGLGLTRHDFTRFIFSASNALVDPEMYTLYTDMNQPLTHYYIASSHNTYLTGHQLHGDSSVDMYRKVLYTGCRCVELDCWDGKDGEPIIFHGHTLTSKIKFRDVIQCVHDHAFVASEYPVILSLEMHCSVPQQDKIAEYIVEILGSMLVLPSEVDHLNVFPSPESLKRRVLIKGKKISNVLGASNLKSTAALSSSPSTTATTTTTATQLSEEDECDEYEDEYDEDDDEYDDDDDEENELIGGTREERLRSLSSSSSLPTNTATTTTATKSADLLTSAEDIQLKEKLKREKKKTAKHTISRKLSDIVVLNSVRFKPPFPSPNSPINLFNMHSFSETHINKFAKKGPEDLYQGLRTYNMNQLSRVYPKGTRFGSTNFDPTASWNAGCQLIALNYQTNDKWMRFNLNKFAENGGTGYILKPLFLRSNNIDDMKRCSTSGSHFKFQLKIISGEALPKPGQSEKGEVVDPYVRLQVYGTVEDSQVISHETKTIWDNGFNPVWNEQVNDFYISCLDLAHLRIAVYDKNKTSKDMFLCETVVPFNELRRGYRNLPMRNEFGKVIDGASVLLHVNYEETMLNQW